MFQTTSFSPNCNYSVAPTTGRDRVSRLAVPSNLLVRRLLPLFTAGILAVSASSVLHNAAGTRAALLRAPGATAADSVGVRQQGLAVAYSERRLAQFGLTAAQLAAALPADTAQSRPGQVVLRADAAGGLQSVADKKLGGLRVGDVAMVVRLP